MTGGLFFFFGSSFHPSGATLLSFTSGSTKKNSLSAMNVKKKHMGKNIKIEDFLQLEDQDQIHNSEIWFRTSRFSVD